MGTQTNCDKHLTLSLHYFNVVPFKYSKSSKIKTWNFRFRERSCSHVSNFGVWKERERERGHVLKKTLLFPNKHVEVFGGFKAQTKRYVPNYR